jgi:hypothetical protein
VREPSGTNGTCYGRINKVTDLKFELCQCVSENCIEGCAGPQMWTPACTRTALAFIRNNPWRAQDIRMNRLLSFFKRRPTMPTSTSFFSTNSPRLSQTQQSNMSPTGALHPPSSTSPEKFENFDLIERVKLGVADITVSSWRSRVTGLRVVHLDYDGERTICRVPSFLLCTSY